MRYHEFLIEEVYASLAVAYHRTNSLENVNAIGHSGFKAGSGAMYGKGIYLTYDFNDQQDESMKANYGPFIIRCKLNLNDYMIFDPDIAKRVYGKSSLAAQFAAFGIKEDIVAKRLLARHLSVLFAPPPRPTAHLALEFVTLYHGRNSGPKRPVKGLVFTGSHDGRVAVAYDAVSVMPLSWAEVNDLSQTRETVKWNKIGASVNWGVKRTHSAPQLQEGSS